MPFDFERYREQAIKSLLSSIRRVGPNSNSVEAIMPISNVVAALRDPSRPPLTNEELNSLMILHPGHYRARSGLLPAGVSQIAVSHNILVNSGRQWLRNLVPAHSFPSPIVADQDLGSDRSIVLSGGNRKTYRVRFIGVGVGGQLQSGPPGPGSQSEEQTVDGLENPHSITGDPSPGPAEWLRQVQPISDISDPELIPSAYSVRFRAVFEESDLSYPESEDSFGNKHGTGYPAGDGLAIPMSEVGLYTSQADPELAPRGGGTSPPPGMVAYNIFQTITKTPHFVFEVAWELLF